jgi:hypothetical protein
VTAAKKPVPLHLWGIWMAILGVALVVFYGILTPLWMVIRFVAWVSERSSLKRP